jgi:nucleotide-binding universal stress UspA family protein
MTQIRHILAATDLSGPARHAVDRAMFIAAESGARLDVLHVVRRDPFDELRRIIGAEAQELEQRSAQGAQEALGRLVAELGAARGVSAEAIANLKTQARVAVPGPALRVLEERWDKNDISAEEYQTYRLAIEMRFRDGGAPLRLEHRELSGAAVEGRHARSVSCRSWTCQVAT